MGENIFYQLKTGGKRFWEHLEANFFSEQGYKVYQSTGKVKPRRLAPCSAQAEFVFFGEPRVQISL